MATIYVNLSLTSNIVGSGTELDPYTYEQMVNYADSSIILDAITPVGVSIASGDIIKIKGQRRNGFYDLGGASVFLPIRTTLTGSIIVEGWDIDTNGSPIAYHDEGDGNNVFMGFYRNSGGPGSLSYSVKDFIFKTDTELRPCVDITGYTATFKDIVFSSVDFISDTFSSNESYYGVSFSCVDLLVGKATVMSYYDSVFDCDSVTFESIGTLNSSYNYTNSNNVTVSLISDITGYTQPQYVSTMTSLPALSTSYSEFVEFYTNNNRMYYADYGVPTVVNIVSFRTTNDYNSGLFNKTRLGPGAYSFFQDPDYNYSVYSTSGHVGSFYFGGDYDNAEATPTPPDLDIEVMDVSTSGTANVSPFSIIEIEPMNILAQGIDNFPFDFSGAPVDGGSPLTVNYHAYNYTPEGSYFGKYEPYEFRWWFDYNVSSGADDYVSCATDRATHVYCGGYLQEFDVRLCIMYRAI